MVNIIEEEPFKKIAEQKVIPFTFEVTEEVKSFLLCKDNYQGPAEDYEEEYCTETATLPRNITEQLSKGLPEWIKEIVDKAKEQHWSARMMFKGFELPPHVDTISEGPNVGALTVLFWVCSQEDYIGRELFWGTFKDGNTSLKDSADWEDPNLVLIDFIKPQTGIGVVIDRLGGSWWHGVRWLLTDCKIITVEYTLEGIVL